MSRVQLRDAKARLSELVEAVEAGDHVVITKHGREAVMIVPLAEGRKLFPERSGRNFFDHLMSIPESVVLEDEERLRVREVDL
jgi:prevent-host-death family protein